MHAKGQLISKCPFGIIVWTKYQRNYFDPPLFLDFCPDFFFCSFLGGFLDNFWAFGGLSIQYHKQESLQEAPKSFQEAPRKVQNISGQKSRNNFVDIFVQTMKPKGHFEINWPLAHRFGHVEFRMSNVYFDFFKCNCLKKTTINIRNWTRSNPWATYKGHKDTFIQINSKNPREKLKPEPNLYNIPVHVICHKS